MKTNKLLKAILLIACVVTALDMSAFVKYFYDENSKLYYGIEEEGDLTCWVTENHSEEGVLHHPYNFEGELIIPDVVENEGKEYRVVGIGYMALINQKITSVKIGKNIESIGKNAFDGTSLTSVSIPDNVTNISDYAFRNCKSLKSMNIGNGVTSIRREQIEGCDNLESIKVASDNKIYATENGVLYSKGYANELNTLIIYPAGKKDLTYSVPEGVKNINDNAFWCNTHVEKVVLPESLFSIGKYAFYKASNLKSVNLPEGINSIGYSAFEKTGISSIVIPGNICWNGESLGSGLFSECPNLTTAVIGEGMTKIPGYLFHSCKKLKKADLPSSVISIGQCAFDSTALESVIIPDKVEEIESGAFSNTKIKTITLPNSIKSIEGGAFSDCKLLESANIYTTTDAAWGSVFNGSNLKNIFVNDDNTAYLSENNVVYTKDKSELLLYPIGRTDKNYDIQEGVSKIGLCAFSGGKYLKSVYIPSSVTSISIAAFQSCSGLEEVHISNTVPPTGEFEYEYKPFDTDTYERATLYVPTGSASAYEAADGWKQFKNIKEKDFGGIANVAGSDVSVTVIDGEIVVSGTDEATEIAVYGIDGRMVYRGAANRIGVTAKGIYIVKVGADTFKVSI